MMPRRRERARNRVASLLRAHADADEARCEALLRSRAEAPAVPPQDDARVILWRINARHDAVLNAQRATSVGLPAWAIMSTARRGTFACFPGDIILLHASGQTTAGIYAAYVATHPAVKCTLPLAHVDNFCQSYRPTRSSAQWRVGARLWAHVRVDKEDCCEFAQHVTPYTFASVAATPSAIRDMLTRVRATSACRREQCECPAHD